MHRDVLTAFYVSAGREVFFLLRIYSGLLFLILSFGLFSLNSPWRRLPLLIPNRQSH